MKFAGLGAALVLSSAAFGQTATRPTGVIIGTVADTNLHPIPLADVSIGGSNVRVTADSGGRFRITDIPVGRFVLIARRIGFAPGVSPVDVAPHDTLWLAFTLEPTAQELSVMVVTEKTLSKKLEEFEERRKFGQGQYFTRADIDKINPIGIVDILRRASAVRISRGGQNALSARAGCPMSIFLDGVALDSIRLDYLPPPNDMAAIEVYAGAATLPLWLPRGSTAGSCGAILFWTKDGS